MSWRDGADLDVSVDARCDRCGAGLKFTEERVIAAEHVHREYECSGCLGAYFTCSAEGFKTMQHVHRH